MLLKNGEKLRVVFLVETIAENMGYAISRVPAALAKHQDVEVHYVTAGLPIHMSMKAFNETYAGFVQDTHAPRANRQIEGYTVHYVDWKPSYGGPRLLGVADKLREIRPHVVQTFGHAVWTSFAAALSQRKLGFKLFTGNHTTASVHPLMTNPVSWFHPRRIREFLVRSLPGRFIASRTSICYGATVDCSEVAAQYYGVPRRQIKLLPLGVDTDIFHPASTDQERADAVAWRQELGIEPDEILCLYTGRFSEDKNPLLLARAVEQLRKQGKRYRAVFVGNGAQLSEIEAIGDTIVRPFVPFQQLAQFYRAADIGVWPTQESTSMIDCAAVGTPIIVNDTVAAVERVQGNGLQYRLNDIEDLKSKLLMLESASMRADLGQFGAKKMERDFSWNALTQSRLDDYRTVLATT